MRDILATFAADEGRAAAANAPEPRLEARRLGRVIARRRAIRTGAASLATVAIVVGTLVVANSLDHSDGPLPPTGPTPAPSTSPTPTTTPAPEPEPTTDAPEPTSAADATPPTEPDAAGPVQLPPGTIATTLVDNLRLRSQPGVGEESATLALLTVGTELRILLGPVLESGHWWFQVTDPTRAFRQAQGTGWVASAAPDGTPWLEPSPLGCMDVEFPVTVPSVESLTELRSEIVGTWHGCVRTPWVAPYEVTITFRSDGTYSSTTTRPGPDGWLPALYYGTDDDSAQKVYTLEYLHDDSLTGAGLIDVVFAVGTTTHDSLQNVSLMGDMLQFEFVHLGVYGPLTYRLFRE